MLTPQEKNRYKRHLNLPMFGEEAQLKLKQASVLVIGAGGLGAPVLNYLTAAGVGTIGVVDADAVEETNLQRQVLFSTNDIKQKKVKTAVEKLSALNPNVSFKSWDVFFDLQNGYEIAKEFQLIVNCSDNYEARYVTDNISLQLKIPWVMGSIHNYEGQVSVFNYNNGPSYQCVFPQAPNRSLFTDADLGVLGVLPSITGSLQANEAIKIITGIGTVLSGTLLVFSLLDTSFTKFKL